MSRTTQWQAVEPVQHPATAYVLASSLWRAEGRGVRCLACTRHCLLHENGLGYCTAIANWRGELYSTTYGVIAEASVTPIESRPIFHYRPGSRTLALGSLGCNLRCSFCQNWEIAFRDGRDGGRLEKPNLPPERAIELALEQECQGIAWTFNEPSISPMYTLHCGRLAHEAGLYTVFVTNGLMTHEALDLLGPYIDVYRVDLKSIEPRFYRQVAATTHIAEILPVARRAQQEYGVHVEVVTNMMPSLNDSEEHLSRLAEQILLHLGENTPWHITTYVPYAKMTHIPPTPQETLLLALSLGKRAGLHFVYTDSVHYPETAHTFCPACGALVIERIARRPVRKALGADGHCGVCGQALPIVLLPDDIDAASLIPDAG